MAQPVEVTQDSAPTDLRPMGRSSLVDPSEGYTSWADTLHRLQKHVTLSNKEGTHGTHGPWGDSPEYVLRGANPPVTSHMTDSI